MLLIKIIFSKKINTSYSSVGRALDCSCFYNNPSIHRDVAGSIEKIRDSG